MNERARVESEFDRLPPMTHYVLGLLRRPTDAPARTPEEADALQEQHLAYLRRLRESGELITTGPVEERGELRGVLVFSTESVTTARELMESDPLVAGGYLVLDLYTWFSPAGLGLSPDPADRSNLSKKGD